MIEINLTPENIRKKRRKKGLQIGIKLPREVLIGSIGGLFFLLIVIHIILFFVNLNLVSQHTQLTEDWNAIDQPYKHVKQKMTKLKNLRKKTEQIKQISESDRIVWSQKLNIISDVISTGAWLRKIAVNNETFYIEGSAISRQKNEMINVHSFASELKDNEDFHAKLKDLELGSIQRRKIKQTEVVDFVITAEIE